MTPARKAHLVLIADNLLALVDELNKIKAAEQAEYDALSEKRKDGETGARTVVWLEYMHLAAEHVTRANDCCIDACNAL